MKMVRLVGRSTVEEIILRYAEQKLQLTHNVMSSTADNVDTDDTSEHRLKVDCTQCHQNCN